LRTFVLSDADSKPHLSLLIKFADTKPYKTIVTGATVDVHWCIFSMCTGAVINTKNCE